MTSFDDADINTWPDGSYYANERDLADLLDRDTIDYYSTMTDYDEGHHTAWALFNLLMMHPAAFLSMIDLGGNDPADALALRLQVQADANDGSGDAFRARLDQRAKHYRTLIDIASKF